MSLFFHFFLYRIYKSFYGTKAKKQVELPIVVILVYFSIVVDNRGKYQRRNYHVLECE